MKHTVKTCKHAKYSEQCSLDMYMNTDEVDL